jgi:hypothetical protein
MRVAAMLALLVAGLAGGGASAAASPVVVGPSVPTSSTGAGSTGTTAAAPAPSAPGASLRLSSSHAGARPVVVRLTLRYEMQCGYPGSGFLTVGLPPQERLPSSFAAASALLDDKRARASLAGKTIRVALPARPDVLCDVIGPGVLRLVLTKAADLGDPERAGTYSVFTRAGSHVFHTTFQITA